MKYLSFKNNDRMPILGLSICTPEAGTVYHAVRQAIKVGFRHFDCTAAYGNEAEVGRAVREAIHDGDVRRNDLWITSKLPITPHKIIEMESALEKTLSDLQVDYLDLYLMQSPVVAGFDRSEELLSEVPLDETWSGMEQSLNAGLVRHIGVSNFDMEKLKEISNGAQIKPELNQVAMHPFLQKQTLVNYCHANLIHMTSYSPLYSMNQIDEMADSDKRALTGQQVIKEIAARRRATPAQILISWSIHKNISVILRPVSEDRLRAHYESLAISLTADDMDKIDTIEQTYRFLNGDDVWLVSGSSYETSNLWEAEQ